MHVAALVMGGGSREEFVKPAVNGMQAILDACRDFGVKRLVNTSSVFSIVGGKDVKKEYDESHWADEEDNIMDYSLSKVLTERMALEYNDSLEEDKKFEVVSVCPSWILGNLFFLV